MIRLEITNITFKGFKPLTNITSELVDIFNNKFKNASIKAAPLYREDTIYFKLVDTDRNKLFLSATPNKVPLKKDDERIKKMGRDYLNTERLTQEQEDSMWKNCINDTLTSLGLSATIKLYEHYDEDKNSFIVLRDGIEFKDWPLKEKVYPIINK